MTGTLLYERQPTSITRGWCSLFCFLIPALYLVGAMVKSLYRNVRFLWPGSFKPVLRVPELRYCREGGGDTQNTV